MGSSQRRLSGEITWTVLFEKMPSYVLKLCCIWFGVPFNFAVRFNVSQMIFHGQDLIDTAHLHQRINGFHDIIGSTVAAVKAVQCCAVHPLLPAAGNGDHVSLILFGEGVHDCSVDLVTQLDILEIFMVSLHLGLLQQIIANLHRWDRHRRNAVGRHHRVHT